jgi:hypothetical protein
MMDYMNGDSMSLDMNVFTFDLHFVDTTRKERRVHSLFDPSAPLGEVRLHHIQGSGCFMPWLASNVPIREQIEGRQIRLSLLHGRFATSDVVIGGGTLPDFEDLGKARPVPAVQISTLITIHLVSMGSYVDRVPSKQPCWIIVCHAGWPTPPRVWDTSPAVDAKPGSTL